MYDKIKTLFEWILRHFGRKRLFCVYVGDTIYTAKESPSCPSYWRGSGVYDIELFQNVYYRIQIVCRTASQARELVQAYIRSPKSFGKYFNTYEFAAPEILDIRLENEDVSQEEYGLYDLEYSGENENRWNTKQYDLELKEAMAAF